MPVNSASCVAFTNARSESSCSNAGECGRGGQCPMPNGVCKLPCNGSGECPDPLTCDETARFCKKN
jgi:hypothetical protein